MLKYYFVEKEVRASPTATTTAHILDNHVLFYSFQVHALMTHASTKPDPSILYDKVLHNLLLVLTYFPFQLDQLTVQNLIHSY